MPKAPIAATSLHQLIENLLKAGFTKTAIKKVLRISRYKMDKTCSELTLLNYIATERKSKLQPYTLLITEWIKQGESVSSIRHHLKKLCVEVHHSSILRFVRKIEWSEDISTLMDLPGEMGYISIIRIPQSPNNYLFCFQLGYSFYNFFHLLKSRNLKSLLECHKKCFVHLSGVPKKIRFCERYPIKLNTSETARYKRYLGSFGARLVQPSSNRHEKNVCAQHAYRAKSEIVASFLHSNMNRLLVALKNRHINSFNLAIHPVTKNPIHKDFEKVEKPLLLAYPGINHNNNTPTQRKVSVRGRVCYQYNFYQLPKHYCGKTITVRVRRKTILFTYLNKKISVKTVSKRKK